MSPALLSVLCALAGVFFTAMLPPQLEIRESWVGPVFFVIAALVAPRSRHRKDLTMLVLGAAAILATTLAGNFDAFGAGRWLLLGILIFRLGQNILNDPEDFDRLALVFTFILLIQLL